MFEGPSALEDHPDIKAAIQRHRFNTNELSKDYQSAAAHLGISVRAFQVFQSNLQYEEGPVAFKARMAALKKGFNSLMSAIEFLSQDVVEELGDFSKIEKEIRKNLKGRGNAYYRKWLREELIPEIKDHVKKLSKLGSQIKRAEGKVEAES
tara:strand:+ start:169 stop:621 length:453 start_codon:yes stop_codon:yes gene_type:complete